MKVIFWKVLPELDTRQKMECYHCKKKSVLRNPKKGSGDVKKHPNTSKVSKKKLKQPTKPLKVLPVYPGEEP